MALATLSIDIVAKLASLEQSLGQAGRTLDKAARDMEGRFASLKSAAASVGSAIAASFAGVQLGQVFQGVVDGLDAFNDLSDATGAAVANLAGLEEVAQRTGASFDTVSTTLTKFTQVLNSATRNSQEAGIFKALGLEAQQLKAMDPADAIVEVAKAFAQFEDNGTKAQYLMALFGKQAREIAPFLKDLADNGFQAKDSMAAMANEAEKFNKALGLLRSNVNQLARDLVGPVITAINKTVEAFKEGDKYGLGFYSTFTRLQKQQLGIEVPTLSEENASRMRRTQSDIDVTVKLLEKLEGSANRDQARIDRLTTKLKLLRDEYEKLQFGPLSISTNPFGQRGKASLPPLDDPRGGRGTRTPPPKAEEYVFKGPEISEAREAALRALDDSIQERARQTTAVIAELAAVWKDSGRSASEYTSIVEKLRGSDIVGPQLPEEEVARRERLNRLLAATPTAQLKAQQAVMRELADAFKAGEISAEQFSEAASTALGNVAPEAQKAVDGMTEFAQEAARNMQDSLGSGLASLLKGEWDNIGRAFGDLVLDMIAQATAANLAELLVGDFAKSGKLGGFIGGLFAPTGSARGNVFNQAGIVRFADGGVFGGRTFFRFGGGQAGELGEAGPEAVMPLKRGRDGKLGIVASGGGGNSVTNHISIGAGLNRGEVGAMMQAYGRQLKGEILSSMRSGGAFAGAR